MSKKKGKTVEPKQQEPDTSADAEKASPADDVVDPLQGATPAPAAGDLVYEDPRVAELEAAYAQSAAHNGTSPNDDAYFRKYVFVLVAAQSRMQDNLIGAVAGVEALALNLKIVMDHNKTLCSRIFQLERMLGVAVETTKEPG